MVVAVVAATFAFSGGISATTAGKMDLARPTVARAQASQERASLRGGPSTPAASAQDDRKAVNAQTYAKLPLAFEPNRGQADSRAKFIAHTPGASVFLTSTGAAVRAVRSTGRDRSARGLAKSSGYAVTMNFKGANPRAAAAGTDRLPGVSNYFIGNKPAEWKTGIPTYEKVRYESIYPGIDLVYYGNRGQLEYDLIVKRGADPSAVRLKFKGADKIAFNRAGDATIGSGNSEMILRRPIGYQPQGAGRTPVAVSYYKTGRDTIGVRVAKYDRGRELVIDPTLIYSTYLGDTFAEAQAVAINPAVGAVVAGFIAEGSSFPTTTGPFGPADGSVNAVVTEFNSTGTALSYSAIFGGSVDETAVADSSFDEALGVALDPSGNIYLTGFTNATDFPTMNTSITGGTTLNQNINTAVHTDAFVIELNTSTGIVYSTYLGGSENDFGNAIAVDGAGDAYVAGSTLSTDFPITSGNAFQITNPSGGAVVEGFVTKLTLSGTVSSGYSTYFGQSASGNPLANGTILNGIAADGSSNVYFAGSAGAGFAVTSGSFAGTWDAIAGRIDTTLSGSVSRIWATYLGGSGADWANAISITPGCVSKCTAFIAGGTTSADFFTTSDTGQGQTPFQSTLGGTVDGFVAELKATDGTPFFSTLLGGEGYDEVRAISVDPFGNSLVTGVTESASFPQNSATSAGLSATLHGPSGALFTSTDGGVTLTAVSGWSGATQGSIRSSSALTFNIGTVPATIYAGSTTGLWVSTNNGTTFTQPASSGLSGAIESLDFTPAGLFAGTTAGLFLSGDGGATFSNLSGIPGADAVYQVGTITPSGFTGTYTAATSNGFFVSDDSGATFTKATGIPNNTQTFASVIDPNTCAFGGSTTCTIYIGTDKGVYQGTVTSGSESLSVIQTNLNYAAVTALGVDTSSIPSTLYASTLGNAGVVVSGNGFSAQTGATQYTTAQNALALALDSATTPATVYAGASSQALTSVFKSTNSGVAYTSQHADLAGAISALQLLSGKLYVGEYLTQDAFITKLNGFGSQVPFSGYLGGTSVDVGNGIATDGAGNSYAAGSTFSSDFLVFPTSGTPAFQTTQGGFVNSFVTDVNLGALVPTPASLTFGSVLFGNTGQTSAALSVKLTNATPSTVTLGTPAITSITGDFAVGTNTCTNGATLAPGATCTTHVTFTPTALGQRLGLLTYSSDAPSSPQIRLFGTGVAPAIKVSPTTLGFAKQTVGTTSAAQLVTLSNSSGVGETITALSTTNADFVASSTTGGATCGTLPSVLATSTSCTISVKFAPSTGTVEHGTLHITDNALGSPQSVALTGTGAPVTITVTPSSIVVPARAVGTTSPGSKVTLKNSANTSGTVITLSARSITGTNATDFAISGTTCGSSLATGASCTVTVTFTPSIIGTEHATLNIPNSSTAGPQSIPLSGTGVATLSVSPSLTTFATRPVSTTSADKFITVKNTTPLVSVTISSITSSKPQFTIDAPHTTCGGSLAPGATCKIAVQFTPTATGSISGVIIITDNAQHSPQQPQVTGSGS
jgi:hypothetical protein